MNFKNTLLTLFSAFFAAALAAGDYAIADLKLDRAGGIYKCGDEVVVTGRLLKGGQPVTEGKVRVVVKWECKEVATQDFPCDGKPFRVTFDKGDKPGWVYFGIQVIDKEGKVVENPGKKAPQGKKLLVAEIGAIYEPEKLRCSYPTPEDFLDFWKGERAKLDKVPLDPKLEKIDSGTPGIDLYIVTVATGADHPVTAYMAIPAGAKPKSLPIQIIYQSLTRSDIPMKYAVLIAKRGAIGMIASWHGLPVGREADFYRKESRAISIINRIDGRENWSFHGMYLRVLRALDYLKTRPEWNGRDLIVEGGSLGGCEAACAAALDPQVTMAIISVCGFCDFNGDLDGRRARYAAKNPAGRQSLAYHDAANFCKFIRCETYFCTGFADEICPPSSVYAAYNNLPAETKKEMFVNVRTGHGGTTYNVKAGKRLKEFFGSIVVQPVPATR